ncbi:hypothetical protein HYW17_02350 [Candidatus Uhrbacteria bacterium]|nr:hypothetical protein [Candidatus Uhrbacteria bacterium]
MPKTPLKPVRGSYLPLLGTISVTGKLLNGRPQRSCPVCCCYLARDREMITVRRLGSRFWVCKSNLVPGDEGCGFAFRVGARKDHVNRWARECADDFLRQAEDGPRQHNQGGLKS